MYHVIDWAGSRVQYNNSDLRECPWEAMDGLNRQYIRYRINEWILNFMIIQETPIFMYIMKTINQFQFFHFSITMQAKKVESYLLAIR